MKENLEKKRNFRNKKEKFWKKKEILNLPG